MCRNLLVLALLLTLSGLFSGTFSQETIIIPPSTPTTVEVPKVTGMDRNEAEKILQKAGLTIARVVERETRFPDGRVVRQQPAAGEKVSKGSGVALVVSKKGAAPFRPAEQEMKTATPAKTSTRAIPDVTGLTFSEAYQQLRRAGFGKIQPQPVRSTEVRETVIGVLANGEEVSALATYAADTPVTLLVSSGPGETPKPAAPKAEMTKPETPKSVVTKPAAPKQEMAAKQTASPEAKDVYIIDKLFEINFVQALLYFKQNGHEVTYQVVKSEKPQGYIVSIRMNGVELAQGDRVPVGQTVALEISGGKEYKPAGGKAQLNLPEMDKANLIDLVDQLKQKGMDVAIEQVPGQAPEGAVTGVTSGKEKLQGSTSLPIGTQVNVQVSAGDQAKAQVPAANAGDPPIILEFDSDTANLLVGHSTGRVTLSWNTASAQRVKIDAWTQNEEGKPSRKTIYDQPVPEAFGTTLASQPGQTTCPVVSPTVFCLTAANAGGTTQKTTVVTVTAPPVIAYFDEGTGHADRPVQPDLQEQSIKDKLIQPLKGPHADAEFMAAPDESEATTTLTWDIRNLGKHGVAIIQPNVGQVSARGSVSVPIAASRAYVLIAHNAAGVDSAVVYVDQPKPQIHHFGANPNPLAHVGDSTHISWRVVGADQIRLVPDGRTVEATGSVDLGLMEPTTFTLMAQNAFDTTRQEITVNISDYQRGIYQFTANPEQIEVGERSVLHAIVLGLGETGRIEFTSEPRMPEINVFNNKIKPTNNMDFGLCVHPRQKTRVKMRVIASDDYTWEKSVEIKAGLTPIIASFGTKNAHILDGHVEGTMYWRVNNATRVSISPDIGDVPVEGERRIIMDSPRLYALTAYGDPSSIVIRDTLWTGNETDLEIPPAIFTYTATPEVVTAGNKNVRLAWEARGIAASITAYQQGAEPRIYSNLPVIGHLDVDPEKSTVYGLKVTSQSGLSHRELTVEMVESPDLHLVALPDTVIVGSSTKLVWKADHLGSSGTVSLTDYGDLQPAGYLVLTPTETQTYTLTASNSAGTARKQITVYVRPPAPYFTLVDELPSMAIRGTNYEINMDVYYADSLMVLEHRAGGEKIILESMQCSPSGKLNRHFNVQLLNGYPIDHAVNTTLEVRLFQWGEWISQQYQVKVLPHVDLQIEPALSYDIHKGYSDGLQSGYNIYADMRIYNRGRDVWRASTVDGAKKVKVMVQFPVFNLDDYNWLAELLGPDVTTCTTLEIPSDVELEPGGNVLLRGTLTLPAFNDGTYEVSTMIDTENLVWEADEGNNIVTDTFTAFFEKECQPQSIGSYGTIDFCVYGLTLSFPLRGE